MAPHSLSPAYIVFTYNTGFGVHKMTIPTKQWLVPNITGAMGSFEAWDATGRDAEDMIDDLVTVLVPWWQSATEFLNAVIFVKATPTSISVPVRNKAIGINGSNTSTAWNKAVEHTWIMRDADYSIGKLVLLDVPSPDDWSPTTDISGITPAVNLFNQISADGNAWATRNDKQIVSLSKITYKLNDKLRREYGDD